jgi:tetratricopeptide (TPR) repeat protein
VIALAASALMLWGACPAAATAAEPATSPQADPAPCVAAAAADDADKTIAVCSTLIVDEKVPKADRIKALIARAGAYQRQDLTDRAIGDYDSVLRLDPTLADIFNARGELWRKKSDRRRALADFAAAVKLNPEHPAAKDNHKSLAHEIERLGAQLAVAGKPSFNCATARRAVEKAICADPELADLDREISAMNIRKMLDAPGPRARRALQREQDAFLASRNGGFGRPDYDLHKAMRERLGRLMAAESK